MAVEKCVYFYYYYYYYYYQYYYYCMVARVCFVTGKTQGFN